MQEEVCFVTTGGGRASDGFRYGGAIFFDVADVGGCREGDGGWIDGIGTLGNAFGCWEEGAKGLRLIGCV
jgi:hypothetical protein